MNDEELLATISDLDGIEVSIENVELHAACVRLRAEGLAEISAPRGPDRKWVRVTVVDQP